MIIYLMDFMFDQKKNRNRFIIQMVKSKIILNIIIFNKLVISYEYYRLQES